MIVAGFGFREAADANSLRDALQQALNGAQLTHLAVPEDKASANAIALLAEELGLPLMKISHDALAEIDTVTQSSVVQELRGTGSAAEAAALAAAGAGGRLMSARRISGDRLATCAIAVGEAS